MLVLQRILRVSLVSRLPPSLRFHYSWVGFQGLRFGSNFVNWDTVYEADNFLHRRTRTIQKEQRGKDHFAAQKLTNR